MFKDFNFEMVGLGGKNDDIDQGGYEGNRSGNYG